LSFKDQVTRGISDIFTQPWNMRAGQVVPSTEDIALAGGAVRLDATFLYADLAQSSYLAQDYQQRTAAKILKSFLYSMSRILTENSGTITSFDGDRVMGVFISGSKNTSAATCALKMNYAVEKILKPKTESHFASIRETGFTISHCVGVDTSEVLVVRAGQRGANDLVWVGRAPNLAAKLSDLRQGSYRSFISENVFNRLNDSAKYGGKENELMWEKCSIKFAGQDTIAYRSSWRWEI